jgi:indole-3-glycerol phosphate synthase
MTPPDTDFMSRIGDERRRRIDAMRLATPAHVLRSRITTRPGGRLERALRRRDPREPLRLVCEIKRASPSRGVLRPDLDPVLVASLYDAGGASAISIVTEPDHFLGELEWVDRVRPVTRLPLLLKDFVVDSYQLLDAAARGADAVLLIVALLGETQLQRLVGEAKILGLDPLVEVHSAEDLQIALRAGATLVGINNRDLRTLAVDPAVALGLLPEVPAMVAAVAESGISTPADITRLRATRCDAVLMGEVFMTSGDPAGTLARLAAAARG